MPVLLVAKTNAMQMPQERESSSLQHHPRTRENPPGRVLPKTYEKGMVPTLEAAQGVVLQCLPIIPPGTVAYFLLPLNFFLILPNTPNF